MKPCLGCARVRALSPSPCSDSTQAGLSGPPARMCMRGRATLMCSRARRSTRAGPGCSRRGWPRWAFRAPAPRKIVNPPRRAQRGVRAHAYSTGYRQTLAGIAVATPRTTAQPQAAHTLATQTKQTHLLSKPEDRGRGALALEQQRARDGNVRGTRARARAGARLRAGRPLRAAPRRGDTAWGHTH